MRVLRLLLSRSFQFLRTTFLWILLLPYATMILGAASNQLVLIANHDRFPVLMNDVQLGKIMQSGQYVTAKDGVILIDSAHCVMTPQTHLNALADVFDFKEYTESVGDMLLDMGAWMGTFAPFVFLGFVVTRLVDNSATKQ